MNRLCLAVFAVLFLVFQSATFAQERTSPDAAKKVRWTQDVSTALKQRQETGRPLIVYVTADYCGYCRKMERDTWSDQTVSQRIQNDFVALKLDAEQNEDLVVKLGIEGLPATIIFDAKGKRVQTISGYSKPASVIEALDSVSDGRAKRGSPGPRLPPR